MADVECGWRAKGMSRARGNGVGRHAARTVLATRPVASRIAFGQAETLDLE